MQFQGGVTRSNLPAFWEKRHENVVLTVVELIADGAFMPKRQLFKNVSDTIPKSMHCVFVPKTGDMIVKVVSNNKKPNYLPVISLYVVTGAEIIAPKKSVITTEQFYQGTDVDAIAEEYGDAAKAFVEAALAKLDADIIQSFYCQNPEFTGMPSDE